MVAGTHPHDYELFEYVEAELPQARREEIAAHLATCGVCAEQVELATMARHSLRGAGLLELPGRRRDEILKSLPAQGHAPGERRAFSPKFVLAGLIGLLAVAAVIGALVNSSSNGGGSNESSAGGALAGETSGGGGTAEAVTGQADLSARGSAADVAKDLRDKGFRAIVQKDRVVVHGATKQQVREVLADRGPGDVEVVVKNP
jgi:anti-sigma factor RsiW